MQATEWQIKNLIARSHRAAKTFECSVKAGLLCKDEGICKKNYDPKNSEKVIWMDAPRDVDVTTTYLHQDLLCFVLVVNTSLGRVNLLKWNRLQNFLSQKVVCGLFRSMSITFPSCQIKN